MTPPEDRPGAEEFMRAERGVVVFRDCSECGEQYPEWTVVSTMRCPACRIRTARLSALEEAAKVARDESYAWEEWQTKQGRSTSEPDVGDAIANALRCLDLKLRALK